MMRGILRWESSLMAICNASVSPSSGTRTGAFILHEKAISRTIEFVTTPNHAPDLQRPRPQYTRTLVLCEVRRRDAHFVGLSLALHARLRRVCLGPLAAWLVLPAFRAVRTAEAVGLFALAGPLAVRELRGEQVVVFVLGCQGMLRLGAARSKSTHEGILGETAR